MLNINIKFTMKYRYISFKLIYSVNCKIDYKKI